MHIWVAVTEMLSCAVTENIGELLSCVYFLSLPGREGPQLVVAICVSSTIGMLMFNTIYHRRNVIV